MKYCQKCGNELFDEAVSTVPEILPILMLGIGIPFAIPSLVQVFAGIKFI